jgi:hypothetical protein
LSKNGPIEGKKRRRKRIEHGFAYFQISGQVSFVPCPATRSGPFLSSSLLFMGRGHVLWAWTSSRLSFNTSTPLEQNRILLINSAK